MDCAKYQHVLNPHHFNQLSPIEKVHVTHVTDPVKYIKMTEEPAPRMDEDKLDFEGPDAEEVGVVLDFLNVQENGLIVSPSARSAS